MMAVDKISCIAGKSAATGDQAGESGHSGSTRREKCGTAPPGDETTESPRSRDPAKQVALAAQKRMEERSAGHVLYGRKQWREILYFSSSIL